MFRLPLRRRSLLALLTASVSAVSWNIPASRADDTHVNVLILSDIHSAYERMGQLLAEVGKQVAAAPERTIIVVNGDVFELGNSVARNSGGEIDWAFLKSLADLAPTVVNIGNHEPDFDNDPASFVARASELGIVVLSNIIDRRSGQQFTEANATLDIAGRRVTLAGIATDSIGTYPKATRELVEIPEPAAWASANLPGILESTDIRIVISHAGVMADRKILPSLPEGTLLVGGHDHLDFIHEEGAKRYVHTGSWGTTIHSASFGIAGAALIRRIDIAADAPSSPELDTLIRSVMATHLTPEERNVVGHSAKAMSGNEAARFAGASMARKTGADIGFIGHTSFGAGLPQGDISQYAFSACLRFDGKLMKAELDAAAMKQILGLCNQDADIPLSSRTGDYLHSSATTLPDAPRYTLVCNDWSAMNQKKYFGREDIVFSEVEGVKLRQTVLDDLRA